MASLPVQTTVTVADPETKLFAGEEMVRLGATVSTMNVTVSTAELPARSHAITSTVWEPFPRPAKEWVVSLDISDHS